MTLNCPEALIVFLSFQVSDDGIMDASAVQFCARKVSAVSGDARKALDICRYAFLPGVFFFVLFFG